MAPPGASPSNIGPAAPAAPALSDFRGVADMIASLPTAHQQLAHPQGTRDLPICPGTTSASARGVVGATNSRVQRSLLSIVPRPPAAGSPASQAQPEMAVVMVGGVPTYVAVALLQWTVRC